MISFVAIMSAMLFARTESTLGKDVDEHAQTASKWADWEAQLEHCLQNQKGDSISRDALSACNSYRHIVAEAPAADMLAMLGQDQHLLLKLAAFYAIQDAYPARTFDAAARSAGTTTRAASPIMGPVYEYLQSLKNTAANRKSLDAMANLPGATQIGCMALVLAIDKTLLYDWYHGTTVAIQQPMLPVVLDSLYGDSKEKKRPPSQRMTAALDTLRSAHGFPLCVYLFWTDEKSPHYESAMRVFLADGASSPLDLTTILLAHGDYIKKTIPLKSLSLTAERRKYLEEKILAIQARGPLPR
ncbi:MAG: hypothetical protein K8T25_20160 [Planctomycetia bacterium]|nr:hypothetical protein [Planctomycetia bacterium]